MWIQVRTVSASQYDVEVEAAQTVLSIKERLASDHDVGEVTTQRLIYQGHILTDPLTVGEVGIREGDFLVLMVPKAATAGASPSAAAAATPVPAPHNRGCSGGAQSPLGQVALFERLKTDLPLHACVGCSSPSMPLGYHYYGQGFGLPLCSICDKVVHSELGWRPSSWAEFVQAAVARGEEALRDRCLSARQRQMAPPYDEALLAEMRESISRCFMPASLFQPLCRMVEVSSERWSAADGFEHGNPACEAVDALFDELECRSLLSAEHASQLLTIASRHAEFCEWWHAIAARVIDKWNLGSCGWSHSMLCYYHLQTENLAKAYRAGGRCGLLCATRAAFRTGENVKVFSARLARREYLWRRVREIARGVGWLARRIRLLYDEVTLRPGHSAAEACLMHFEEMTSAQSAKSASVAMSTSVRPVDAASPSEDQHGSGPRGRDGSGPSETHSSHPRRSARLAALMASPHVPATSATLARKRRRVAS